jgi:hypothetical protein
MDNITKNRIALFLFILIIAGLIFGGFYLKSMYTMKNDLVQDNTDIATTTAPIVVASSTEVEVVGKKGVLEIYNLKEGQVISNKFTIEGRAAGWYFEGSFPIEIVDSKGKTIATSPAVAQTNWMTGEFVNFKAEMSLASTTSSTGTIIFKKDNPSAEPKFDDSFSLTVKFNLSN